MECSRHMQSLTTGLAVLAGKQCNFASIVSDMQGRCTEGKKKNIQHHLQKNAHLRRYPRRSNSTKGERVCVCVLVRVVRGMTPGRSTNTQQRCDGYGYYTISKNVWLTSSPLAPRLEDEPWLWEVSAAPPEDAFSLLCASLLLPVNTRASSCCCASCGAHRTKPGKLVWCRSNKRWKTPHFNER